MVSAVAPMAARFADGTLIGATEPLSVVFDPIHDIHGPGIRLDAAAFTPLVNFDLFDLQLHIV